MWSEPFIKECVQTGQKVAVLLMDTQGMFDNDTTMTLTAQIFGLSTMMASYQIYNVQNRIQEDNLQHLALFSEYGRLAHASSVKGSSAKGGSAEGEKKEEEVVLPTVGKPFQMIQFLVRDSSVIDDFDCSSSEETQNLQYQALRGEMLTEFQVRN